MISEDYVIFRNRKEAGNLIKNAEALNLQNVTLSRSSIDLDLENFSSGELTSKLPLI